MAGGLVSHVIKYRFVPLIGTWKVSKWLYENGQELNLRAIDRLYGFFVFLTVAIPG